MMDLGELKFDTPNNVCLSLRVIAEMVRSGEIMAEDAHIAPLLSPAEAAGRVRPLRKRFVLEVRLG